MRRRDGDRLAVPARRDRGRRSKGAVRRTRGQADVDLRRLARQNRQIRVADIHGQLWMGACVENLMRAALGQLRRECGEHPRALRERRTELAASYRKDT